MKFEIDRQGFGMIATYLKEINLNTVITIEPTRLLISQYDTARARALILEYPVKIVEGDPTTFATRTDWLYDKVRLLKSKSVICEIDEQYLILRQERTIKDVKMRQKYEIVLLDMEDTLVGGVVIDDEPKVEGTVFCELTDVVIVAEALNAIDSDTFYISAVDDQLVIESETDYQTPASTITLFTPSIVKEEDNKTHHDRKQIASLLTGLTGTVMTTLTFSKDGILVIEATGEDIRVKLYSAPIVD